MNFGTCVKPRVSGCVHPLIGRHGEEANLRMMHFLFEIALKNFLKNVLIGLTSFSNMDNFAPGTAGSMWARWPKVFVDQSERPWTQARLGLGWFWWLNENRGC